MTSMVTLTSGEQVSKDIFEKTRNSLLNLAKENPLTLYQLYEKCRDSEYVILNSEWGSSTNILKKLDLINEQHEVNNTIKAIVLNSLIHKPLRSSISLVDPTINTK